MRTSAQGAGTPYGGTYMTDTEVMSAAANHVSQTGTDMTAAVDKLMTNLSDLPSGWAGSAADAFYGPNGAQEHWQKKHNELINACNAIADALNSSTQGYLNSEQDSTTAVRNATPY